MKAAPRPLARLLRDVFRLEPLEPRILLSADPVLGAAAAVLATPREEAAALFDAYAAKADMVVSTTPGQVVLVTSGPALNAQPGWLVVDVSQLNGGNGTLVIGGPDSDAKIFIGEVGGPAVRLKDLVLLNPAEGGHVTHQAPLLLTGELHAVGSGHTDDIATDQSGASFNYTDTVIIHGDRTITATGVGVRFGSVPGSYFVTGDGDAVNDTLTLRVDGDVTFNNAIGGSDLLEKLVIDSVTPNGSDLPNSVTFNAAVTLNGNLEIRADANSTIVFNSAVTLNNGGDLIIIGAGSVQFKAGLQMTGTSGGFAGDASITADEIDFTGTSESIKGTGVLTLRPLTASNPIDVGSIDASSGNTLNLDTAELGKLADGFSKIVIGYQSAGHAVAGSGAVRLGAKAQPDPLLRDNIEVYGSTISIEDPLGATDQLVVYGSVKLDALGDITIKSVLTARDATGQTASRAPVELFSLNGGVAQVDSLDDNNTGAEPLRASSLTVRAATGISLPYTEITDLRATNVTSGGISITETASGGDVNVVLLSQAANASGLSLHTTAGALTISGSVSHAGTGLTELATAGTAKAITVNAAINSTGGAIKLTATGAVATTAAITTDAAAALEVDAGTSYQQGALVASRGGDVKITAANALQMLAGTTVRSLDAGGTVGTVRLKATSAVTGNVTLANVQAGSKMFVDAGAAILALVSSDPNLDGETAAVLLAAASGIGTGGAPLQTRVGSLAAKNTGSGGIFVREATSLVLTSNETGIAYGLEAVGTGGEISVVTLDGSLTVGKSVTSTGTIGNILLQGGEILVNEATTTADLTVSANVASSNGSISLAAADGISIQDGAAGGPAVTTTGNGSQFVDVRADDGISMEGAARLAAVNGGTIWVAAGAGSVDVGMIDAGSAGKAFVSAGTHITDAQADDAGVRTVNVTASQVRLSAGGAIGAAGALLDTRAATLAASAAGAGGLFLSEHDALTLGAVGAAGSSRVGSDGNVGSAAGASTLAGLDSAGALVLHAGGNLVAQSAVRSAGNLHLDADGTIDLSAAVVSTGGHASVLAAGQLNLNAAASIDVQSAGKTLDLASTTSALAMFDGATASTNGGAVRVGAFTSATLSRVDARTTADRLASSLDHQANWGDVNVVAGGGILGNASSAAPDVFARQLRMDAGVIGGDLVNLQTEVSLLSARTTGLGGDVYILEATALELGTSAVSTVYRVDTAAATGAATEQVGTALAGVSASGALVLRTTAGAVTGGATGAVSAGGNLLLRTAPGFDIDLDANVRSTGGHLSLDSGRNLLLDGNIGADAATGTVDLAATGAITLAQAKKVSSAGGNISIDAGGVVTLEEVDAAGGSVRIKGSAIVDGDAAGDTEVDVKASGLVLTGTAGIGAVGATLETQATTLSAVATSGGVYLRESDGATVTGLTVNVERVATNAGSAATAFTAQEDLRGTAVFLTSASGDLVVQAGTAGSAGVVATSGAVRLQAGGALQVQASVQAAASLSMIGGGAVSVGASDAVVISGSTIDIESTASTLTMAANAAARTTAGAIRAAAQGDVQLAVLDARTSTDRSGDVLDQQGSWGAVSVLSTTGSITDAAGPLVAVYARDLRLEAGTGVGAATGNLAIQTEASVLSAKAGTGGVFLADRSALTVGETAAIGVLRPDADGTVPGTPGSVGDALQAGVASGGVAAVVAAGALDTTRTVQAAGNLLLRANGATLTTGALVRSTGGNLALYSGGAITLNADVDTQASGKTIVVDAQGAITQAQDTTLLSNDGNVAVAARSGVLTVESMSAGSAMLHASGTTIVDGDAAGDTDTDFTAGALRLLSTSGIGEMDDAIETETLLLAARSSGGKVFVTDATALTVGTVDGVLVQEIDATGGATGATRTGGNGVVGTDVVVRTVAEALTVATGHVATASGNLLLQAGTAATAGNSLTIAAGASATADGGSMSLVAGDAVVVSGSVSVINGIGTLDIRGARADLAQDGTVSTAGGDLSLVVTGTARIEKIDAGTGAVYVKANRIEDGDAAGDVEVEVDILAARLALDANQYVGLGGNAVETDVFAMSVHAGTNAFVTEANWLTLSTVSVFVHHVSTAGLVFAQAPVTQSNNNATGGNFVLRVLSEGLQTTATGSVTAGGNLLLESLGTLSGITVGADVRSTGGSLSLRATGVLQLDASVQTAGGTIELKGDTGLTQAQDTAITTNGGHASLEGGMGNVTLERVTAGIGRVRITGASVVDGDAATDDLDVTANSVLFTATGGVGSAANALEITATTASASAIGGVFLAETDALDLGTASYTVQKITASGAFALQATTGSQSGVTGTDVVVRALGGNLDIKGGNAVTAAGNLLLEAVGATSTLTVGSQVRATAGAVSLVAGAGMTLNADVSSTFADAAGTVDLRAGGAFLQAQGTSASTAGANLALAAGGTATIESFSAGAGDLRVSAASILDGDAAASDDADLVGDETKLEATAGDIGASGAALDTTARVLAAQATGGSIFVTETDALHVGSVAVDVRNVSATAGAAVQGTADAALAGLAGEAVVLQTLAGSLAIDAAAAVAASGNMLLAASGSGSDLSVAASLSAGGAMSLSAARNVTVGAAVSSTGDAANTIDIVATTGTLTMEQDSDVTTFNANVLLQAQGDVTVEHIDAGSGAVRLAGAAIVDGDTAAAEAEVDVIASQLQIDVTGAIGAAANPLETTVETLSAAAGSGIFVTETDALVITDTSHSVNRVVAAGTATATTATTQSDIGSTGNGNIVLVAGGDIDLPANADVRTGGAATIDITSIAGHVLMEAGNPGQGVLQTGTGDIRVKAHGDIRPGALLTDGHAYLDSASGRVLIAGDLQRNGEDIDLRGDDLVITVPVASPGATLTIGPLTTGTPVVVGGPAPGTGLHLDTSEIALLQDGFANIVIGSTLADQAVSIVGTGTPVVFLDPLELVATGTGGSIAITGALEAETLTVRDSGAATTLTDATVTSQGAVTIEDQLLVGGANSIMSGAAGMQFTGSVTGAGGAGDTLALDGNGGNLGFTEAVTGLDALTIADAGDVSFGQDVTIDGDLTIEATGTVTFTGLLTLNNGGRLIITGGGIVVFETGASLGSGDATLEVGDLRSTAAAGSIGGTGTIWVSGAAADTAIRLGDGVGTGGLAIDAATLAALGDGFAAIRFGSGFGAGAGVITVGTADLRATDARIELQGSTITVAAAGGGLRIDSGLSLHANGAIDASGSIAASAAADITVQSDAGAVTMSAGASIASDGGEIQVSAAGDLGIATLDARVAGGGGAGTVRLTSGTGVIVDANGDAAVDVYAQALDFLAAGPGAGNVLEVSAPIIHVTPPAGGLLLRESADGVTYFNVLSGGTVSQAVVAFGTAVRVTTDSADYTSDPDLLADMGLASPLSPSGSAPAATFSTFSGDAAASGFGAQVSSYLASGSSMAAPSLVLSQRLLADADLSFASGQEVNVESGVDWWLEAVDL